VRTLIKSDPVKHMHRWYAVGIQGTLIDELAVVYGWGSLNSSYQQWRRIVVSTQGEAERLFDQMVEIRMKRGYIPATKEITNRVSKV
jgi:predicted DNA-binding WGR domain protein